MKTIHFVIEKDKNTNRYEWATPVSKHALHNLRVACCDFLGAICTANIDEIPTARPLDGGENMRLYRMAFMSRPYTVQDMPRVSMDIFKLCTGKPHEPESLCAHYDYASVFFCVGDDVEDTAPNYKSLFDVASDVYQLGLHSSAISDFLFLARLDELVRKSLFFQYVGVRPEKEGDFLFMPTEDGLLECYADKPFFRSCEYQTRLRGVIFDAWEKHKAAVRENMAGMVD